MTPRLLALAASITASAGAALVIAGAEPWLDVTDQGGTAVLVALVVLLGFGQLANPPQPPPPPPPPIPLPPVPPLPPAPGGPPSFAPLGLAAYGRSAAGPIGGGCRGEATPTPTTEPPLAAAPVLQVSGCSTGRGFASARAGKPAATTTQHNPLPGSGVRAGSPQRSPGRTRRASVRLGVAGRCSR